MENLKMARIRRIVRIKGDGIGGEVMDATCGVIEAAGVNLEWVDKSFSC